MPADGRVRFQPPGKAAVGVLFAGAVDLVAEGEIGQRAVQIPGGEVQQILHRGVQRARRGDGVIFLPLPAAAWLVLLIIARQVHVAQEGIPEAQVLPDIAGQAVPKALAARLAHDVAQDAHADVGIGELVGLVLQHGLPDDLDHARVVQLAPEGVRVEQAALPVHLQKEGDGGPQGVGLGGEAGGVGGQLLEARIIPLRQAGDVPVDGGVQVQLSFRHILREPGRHEGFADGPHGIDQRIRPFLPVRAPVDHLFLPIPQYTDGQLHMLSALIQAVDLLPGSLRKLHGPLLL